MWNVCAYQNNDNTVITIRCVYNGNSSVLTLKQWQPFDVFIMGTKAHNNNNIMIVNMIA